MKKVLITDDVHPILISGLEEKQYEVHFYLYFSFAETLAVIDFYDGLIINSKLFS